VQTVAFVREPSAALERCELTHLERIGIDVARARAQHARYAAELDRLGAAVHWLPALEDHPDGVFVEDTAVIVPEVAVITRPGAKSRQGEVTSVAEALRAFRTLRRIEAPASLDGGDVLRVGRTLMVGLSSRTNAEGCAQLQGAVKEFGYDVQAVQVDGCLHLKSACSRIAPDTVLANLDYIRRELFGDLRVIAVDSRESDAANTVTVGGVTLVSAAFPYTEEKLRRSGIMTKSLDVSELHKAEAGLTCMSLVLEA
jgi:dimethylargininase